MHARLVHSLLIGGLSVVVGGSLALAQPMMGSPGAGQGSGPGMMGSGMMGPGMMGRGAGPQRGFGDPVAYLDSLKSSLKISAAQDAAWAIYADTVKATATQMQGVHQTMYESMGTATWQERRDMMNRMFEARQQAFDAVHAAAEKLLPTLDAAQKTQAERSLPGLAGPGHMMGRRPI
jgi:hypothetical protein